MFKQISSFLRDLTAEDEAIESGDDLQIAAAALMIEAGSIDGDLDPREQAAITQSLQRHFGLTQAEVDGLFAQAHEAHHESSQLLRFTRALKERYSEEQRTEIIEMLWEVAYADGALHAYEDNLLRRIGGLLYVSDRDRGEARKRVLERLRREQ